jgi:hypothetical protein
MDLIEPGHQWLVSARVRDAVQSKSAGILPLTKNLMHAAFVKPVAADGVP